jgi:branched-chain amino acid transport system substrate-binding protein
MLRLIGAYQIADDWVGTTSVTSKLRSLRLLYPLIEKFKDFNMKIKKITIKIIYFFILSLLFFTILPDLALSQSPLKVGALIPYTGRWGDSGRECAKGMLDAAKWLNLHEGVFGMKLEVILIDDTSQPAETMAAYRKLNEVDRILLLYIYSMETALALVPHFHFDRIPTFISSLPSQFANPSKYPYVFSITSTPIDLAKIAMNFISEKSGIKGRKPKVVFVGSPDYFGQHFLEEAKAYAKTLGIDVGPDFWISDISPSPERAGKNFLLLSAINSYKPDFTYLSLTSKEASSLLEEAKKMDIKTKWICAMRAFDENLMPFDGVLGVQPISPFGEDVPWMAGIKEAHQRWHPYDSKTLTYVEGWATTQVISEALGKSLSQQSTSRERVKLALEGFKNLVTGGLTPPLTFTSKDHRPSVESRIFIIKDGKLSRYTSFISVER